MPFKTDKGEGKAFKYTSSSQESSFFCSSSKTLRIYCFSVKRWNKSSFLIPSFPLDSCWIKKLYSFTTWFIKRKARSNEAFISWLVFNWWAVTLNGCHLALTVDYYFIYKSFLSRAVETCHFEWNCCVWGLCNGSTGRNMGKSF